MRNKNFLQRLGGSWFLNIDFFNKKNSNIMEKEGTQNEK